MLRLRVAGVCDSVEGGIAAARKAIAAGTASETLDRLLAAST
jgi:anthranilate phosphoribosyltransferase